MPVLEIQALPQKTSVNPQALMQSLATTVAQQMGIPANAVRCIWQEVHPAYYMLGGQSNSSNECGPIVKFTLFEGRGEKFIESILQAIANILSERLEIDRRSICIIVHEAKFYQVLDKGQVFKP